MRRLLALAVLVASCSSAPAVRPTAPVTPPGSGLEALMRAALARGETKATYRWSDGRDLRSEVAKLNTLLTDPSVSGSFYLDSWQTQTQVSEEGATLSVQFHYRTGAQTKAVMAAVDAKINAVLAQTLKPGQSEFDIELALHDWLVNHARYDDANYDANTVPGDEYTPYGVLVKGTGVCESYTTAFYLLAKKAGLDVRVVTGLARGAHSWNQVKVGGQWYHLDVTWDDPVGQGDKLDHTYFNLDDDSLQRVHQWDRSEAPPCTATAENWFVKNNLTCANFTEFQAVAKAALQSRQTSLLRRVVQFDPLTFDNAVANALKAAARGLGRSVRWSYSTEAPLGVVEVLFL